MISSRLLCDILAAVRRWLHIVGIITGWSSGVGDYERNITIHVISGGRASHDNVCILLECVFV